MPKPEADKPKDFREIRVGHLAARVYKDGTTKIGALVERQDVSAVIGVEVEIKMSAKQAKDFAEALLGIIKQHEGSY